MSLTFDPVKHEYRWKGEVVPSVTQLLRPLMDFSHVQPDVLDAAAAFGTAVHLACELDDLGTLDEEQLDPALAPYLAGWRKFCREHECVWEWVERPVFHEGLRYAGTLDRAGRVDGVHSIVDIKSGSALMPTTGPQLAAYARAHDPNGALLNRFAVRLFPDGYELKQYTSAMDWPVFASLVTVRQFCNTHNLKELSHV